MKKILEKKIVVSKVDLDDLNHVNNIVYIHWILDIAKRHWESLVSSQTLENYYWVLLDHNIKYLRPALLKDKIKNKTCRLLLMSATPFINEPMHLIKLLNLILYDKLPENKTEFTNSFLQSDGINFTIKGATEFINKIHKNISYLDLTKDLSKFAIQVRINI